MVGFVLPLPLINRQLFTFDRDRAMILVRIGEFVAHPCLFSRRITTALLLFKAVRF